MRIVFTKSQKIVSRLICWVLDEPVSHVATIFLEKYAFHATLAGVKSQSMEDFNENYQVIYGIYIPMDEEKEKELYNSISKKLEGRKYDQGAFLYFSWRAILRKLFNIPLPKNNLWNSNRDEICTEVATYILNLKNVDASMMTPYQLYKFLEKQYGEVHF